MQRRRVLQMGAALATLPLAGCGAGTPDPKPAPTAASDLPANEKIAAVAPAPPAPPSADPAPTAPVDKAPDAAKDAPPKYTFSRVVGKIGKNHRHVLVVPFEDVKAGAEKSYDIAGAAGHPHSVTLSPDQMKSLLAGQDVRTKSSIDHQHAHRILVKCAPAVDPPEWVNAVTVEFSGKDEHELVVTAADLAARTEKSYDVQGIAGHAHQVTISAADFEKLSKAGNTKMFTSRAEDGHDHLAVIYNRPPKAQG
jgi:hypothetical protein